MNKLVAIVFTTATLVSTAVKADVEPKFYAGVEGVYSHFHLDGLYKDQTDTSGKSVYAKKAPALALFAGSRINQNFGFEFGGQMYKNRRVTLNGSDASIRNSNLFVDALGVVPMNEVINFVGSVGVGRLRTTKAYKTNASQWANTSSNTKVGVRVGAGCEYLFGENLNTGARAMLRYQNGNHVIKNIKSATLGLFYNF